MAWEMVIPEAIASLNRQADAGGLPAASLLMDSDAFAAFYERSARALWAYVARVSGDASLADDLTQESYVRFLCAVQQPLLDEGEVAGRRYLYRIATNLLRDHWRRPRPASIEDISEELLSCEDDSAASDSQAVLMPAMAQLRPRDRQLLWLAHAEGYSHQEIAEITGLASASIRLLLFRARRKMARLLRHPNARPNARPGARPTARLPNARTQGPC